MHGGKEENIKYGKYSVSSSYCRTAEEAMSLLDRLKHTSGAKVTLLQAQCTCSAYTLCIPFVHFFLEPSDYQLLKSQFIAPHFCSEEHVKYGPSGYLKIQ
jgi:hypothetical protein